MEITPELSLVEAHPEKCSWCGICAEPCPTGNFITMVIPATEPM